MLLLLQGGSGGVTARGLLSQLRAMRWPADAAACDVRLRFPCCCCRWGGVGMHCWVVPAAAPVAAAAAAADTTASADGAMRPTADGRGGFWLPGCTART
jgi:hypothetical protein